MFKVMVVDDDYVALAALCKSIKNSQAKFSSRLICLSNEPENLEHYDAIWSSKEVRDNRIDHLGDVELCVICVPFKLDLSPEDNASKICIQPENKIENDSVWTELIYPIAEKNYFDMLVVDANLTGEKDQPNAWVIGRRLAELIANRGLNFPDWKMDPYVIWTGQSDAQSLVKRKDSDCIRINKAGTDSDEYGYNLLASEIFKRMGGNLSLECASLFNTSWGNNVGHGLPYGANLPSDFSKVRQFIARRAERCSLLLGAAGLRLESEQCRLVSDKFIPNLAKLTSKFNTEYYICTELELCSIFWDEIKHQSVEWMDPLGGIDETVKQEIVRCTSNSEVRNQGILSFEDWREVYFKMRFCPIDEKGGSWMKALESSIKARNGEDIIVHDAIYSNSGKIEIFLPKAWMAKLFDHLSSRRYFMRKLLSENTRQEVWLSIRRINLEVDKGCQPYYAIINISSTLTFSANETQMPGALSFLVNPHHLKHIYRCYVAVKSGNNKKIFEVVSSGNGHQIKIENTIDSVIDAEDVLIDKDAASGFALVFNSIEPIDQ